MGYRQLIWLILVLTLVLSCHLCECASHSKRVASQNRVRNDADEARLVRLKLARINELDSFEALSRSGEIVRASLQSKVYQPLGLNTQMVAVIGIGVPLQEFRLFIDTFWANMWVASTSCDNCGSQRRYNSSASATYIKDGRPIELGWNYGFRSIDQVVVGDIIIKNQTFAEIDHSVPNYFRVPCDGLFGLAFDDVIQQHIVSPLRQMLNQGSIAEEVFSIYQNSTGGEIVFGGTDASHYKGAIHYQPNQEPDDVRWGFKIDSISLEQGRGGAGFERTIVCADGCIAHVYTRLPFIIGPPEDVAAINEAMGAQVDEDDDSIFVLPDCDLSKLSNLTFSISSIEFELSPEVYVQKVQKGGDIICVSSFRVVYPNTPFWFVGSSFVGHIYTVFDYSNKRMGFARSN